MASIMLIAHMSVSTRNHLCGVEFFSADDAFMFLTSLHPCFPVHLMYAIDVVWIKVYAFFGAPAVTDVSADGRVKLGYHIWD
jgi:hypothetical protein